MKMIWGFLVLGLAVLTGACQTPSRQVVNYQAVTHDMNCDGLRFRLNYKYEYPLAYVSNDQFEVSYRFYDLYADVPQYDLSDVRSGFNLMPFSNTYTSVAQETDGVALIASDYTNTDIAAFNTLFAWDHKVEAAAPGNFRANPKENLFMEHASLGDVSLLSVLYPVWPETNGFTRVGTLVFHHTGEKGSQFENFDAVQFSFRRGDGYKNFENCASKIVNVYRAKNNIRYYMPNISVAAGYQVVDAQGNEDLVVDVFSRDTWTYQYSYKHYLQDSSRPDDAATFFDPDNGLYSLVFTKLDDSSFDMAGNFVGSVDDIYDNIDNSIYPGPNTTPTSEFCRINRETAFPRLMGKFPLLECALVPGIAVSGARYAVFAYYRDEDGSQERLSNIAFFQQP